MKETSEKKAEPEAKPAAEVKETSEKKAEPEAKPEAEAKETSEKRDAAEIPEARKKPAEKEAEKKKDAAPAEKTAGFEKLKKPDGEADDLKMFTGIGPALETKLNDYGIFHYRQIAALKKPDIAEIDDALTLKGRIESDDWVKQARELAKKSG